MRAYAVEFMLHGRMVGREFVQAFNPAHAKRLAERRTPVAKYDAIEWTAL